MDAARIVRRHLAQGHDQGSAPMTQQRMGDVSVLPEKIRGIIDQELELEPGELTQTGHFIDDYDADSLSLITIVARIEKELGVIVPQDELPNMANLEAVFDVVGRYAGKEPRGV
jgi:acyl carrier protein